MKDWTARLLCNSTLNMT